MIDNLKMLISEMDNKSEFVKEVAEYYKQSFDYLFMNWFQKDWKVPVSKLPKIIEMAQNWLFAQNQRKEKVLKDTGFKITA
jgi:hypothetical protein